LWAFNGGKEEASGVAYPGLVRQTRKKEKRQK